MTEPIFNSPDPCPHCVFLGSFQGEDLYFCTQGGKTPTVMAVHSEEPGDYQSGLASAEYIPALKVAKTMAIALGLLEDTSKTGSDISTELRLARALETIEELRKEISVLHARLSISPF